MTPHVYPLAEEWGLWRCVALRAAGFPAQVPTPEDCWLPDAAGNRYTSELRLVCVDRTRYPG